MIFSAVCHAVAFTTLVLSWLLLPSFVVQVFVNVAAVCVFLYLSYQFGSLLDTLPRFRVSAKRKAVLVTGCDTGFGHLLAQRLDSIGYKVFAGCVNPYENGALQLKSSSSERLHIVPLDVTDDQNVSEALKIVQENLEECQLWAVVNNAGVALCAELEWTPLQEYKRQFEVNTFGVVRVTQTFLPLLRRNKGRVVVTTSMGSRFTLTGISSYCMSKHASSSFCDGLRMEMKKFDVPVISVEPFSYQTPMTKMNNFTMSADKTWSMASASVKQEYGEDYLEQFKSIIEKYNGHTANPNVHEVVDCLVEAVTCTSPHNSYSPGSLRDRATFWFLKRMPRFLEQYIIRKFITFDSKLTSYVRRRGNHAAKKDS